MPADPVFQLPGIFTRHGDNFYIPMHVLELSYNLLAINGCRAGQQEVKQEQIKLSMLSPHEAVFRGVRRHDLAPAHFQRGRNRLRRLFIAFRKEDFHRVTFSSLGRIFVLFIGKLCANVRSSQRNSPFYMAF
ncbi:MAG: hypothetical protein MUC57_09955 [Desulfobacterales bacterium]|nr:hypothetical protein [Desulfobacterales bacterium]